jgi:flavin-dependent dehydrogenase
MKVDVAIVGGGPAGLAAAIHCARRGLDVVVLERRLPPLDKACGEGLLPAGLRELEALGARGMIGPEDCSPIDGLRYVQEDGSYLEGMLPGLGLGVRRLALTAALESRARAMGARIFHGRAVVGFVRTTGGVRLSVARTALEQGESPLAGSLLVGQQPEAPGESPRQRSDFAGRRVWAPGVGAAEVACAAPPAAVRAHPPPLPGLTVSERASHRTVRFTPDPTFLPPGLGASSFARLDGSPLPEPPAPITDEKTALMHLPEMDDEVTDPMPELARRRGPGAAGGPRSEVNSAEPVTHVSGGVEVSRPEEYAPEPVTHVSGDAGASLGERDEAEPVTHVSGDAGASLGERDEAEPVTHVSGDAESPRRDADPRRGPATPLGREADEATAPMPALAQRLADSERSYRLSTAVLGSTLDSTTELIEAAVVIAADGLASPLRSAAGLELPLRGRARFGLRQHFARAPWSRKVEVHLAPGAEAYVTPVGAQRVGVAFLFEPGPQRASFDSLARLFPKLMERFEGVPADSRPRGAGPLARRARAPVADRLVLLGDAAGYVDAITGEGLSLAFQSAAALGRVLPEALTEGGSARAFGPYARAWGQLYWRYSILTGGMLALARRPALRRRVLSGLNSRTFEKLLAWGLGEEGLPRSAWPDPAL